MNWVNELEKAIELINAEEFDNCVAHVNTVLRDTTPGYPRIRYYALLALYFRLARGRKDCFSNWQLLNKPGDFPGVDGVRDELSAILEEVAEDLKSRRPSDWYIHQMTWTETDVEEYQAELAELERLARLEEGQEDDDDDEEAEIEEEEAELSPTELAAPNKATDEESDTRMRARNKTADAVDATQPDT
ncbi:hypothetical protein D6C91_07292 [Aureobasidium pullulans]|uniref:Uncharacterized protein n=1 Tax=Aureobasidium pullulans TaxID=5580 RepID=A0A4S9SSZ1_AURPU|nr:hypothetical protein D6C97_03499 [Aureobasidium pullulans]THZ14478.1 hypothetical protein D6C91_07292 [Aureobasidium pullulans]